MSERKKASLELDHTMGVLEIAEALDRMVFTAAREWRRSVSMDRNTRDMIVRAIRRSHGASHD